MVDERAARLAEDVAAAVDAWLTDPQDAEVYRRMVAARAAWRAYARPTLDGLETAGRRTARGGPHLVADGLPADPKDAVDKLTGRSATVTPAD
jgi:hypothetical protein